MTRRGRRSSSRCSVSLARGSGWCAARTVRSVHARPCWPAIAVKNESVLPVNAWARIAWLRSAIAVDPRARVGGCASPAAGDVGPPRDVAHLVRLIGARCEGLYSGRLLQARPPEALRLIMVKSDGSVMVHADPGGYKPQNWMTPPCVMEESEGAIVVRKVKGEDRLDI